MNVFCSAKYIHIAYYVVLYFLLTAHAHAHGMGHGPNNVLGLAPAPAHPMGLTGSSVGGQGTGTQQAIDRQYNITYMEYYRQHK